MDSNIVSALDISNKLELNNDDNYNEDTGMSIYTSTTEKDDKVRIESEKEDRDKLRKDTGADTDRSKVRKLKDEDDKDIDKSDKHKSKKKRKVITYTILLDFLQLPLFIVIEQRS